MASIREPRAPYGSGGDQTTRARGQIRPLEPRESALPHNREVERNLLGSILIDPSAAPLLDSMEPSDFFLPANQVVCEAAKGVRAEGEVVDLATVDEWLRARSRLPEAGGQSAISELTTSVISPAHAPTYLRALLRLSAQRAGVLAGADFVAAAARPEAYDGGSLETFWERLRERVDGALNRLADVAVDAKDGYSAPDLMRMEFPEQAWIVPNLLPAGLSILASKQKIGKSWLALCLAIAVAAGGVALSHEHLDTPRDVLYLALEDKPRRLQSRMRQLLQEDSPPARLTIFTKWARLDHGGLRRLERWYADHAGGLVIVDVLAKVRPPRAKGGDIYAEDYTVMASLKDLADRYAGGLLVVHHTRKAAAEDVFDEIRDSAGLTGACDGVMVLQRTRGEDMATLHVTGRDFADEAQLALQRDKLTAGWLLLGDAREMGVSDARREIIALLRRAKRAMTPQHIADSLGKNYSTVKNLLPRMVQDSQVTNHYNGTYSVDSVDSIDSIDHVDSVDRRPYVDH